ncbi:MAG: adenylosuccinate lyase [bacterium]|nr:adenylosuccinate lyase [bacterium]
MIERYTLPQMGNIWTLENRYRKILDVEICACEAQAQIGNIPQEAVAVIKEKARFDMARVEEIEKTTQHDVIALLTNVAEYVGEESRYIHLGLTSYDVVDTALSLMIKEASEIVENDLFELSEMLLGQAQKYKNTVMIGRTHGIHAEPMTFGLKLALWFKETGRNSIRMKAARECISVGKLSGAVGTYSQISPRIEEYVCANLGLVPTAISTQIIQRDRHAQILTTLAIIASSLDKFATEIRNLARTDIREVEEYFGKGQKGSSAMPHKRNPVICERISGLARIVRANALAGLENVALWHERDITHSSVERLIIPQSFILTDYMLVKFKEIIQTLVVYPENMEKNMDKTHGLIYSQRVLLAMAQKGMLREDAYRLVQRNAMKSLDEGVSFKDLLKKDKEIRHVLSIKEIDTCFNLKPYLRHVDYIFNRL